MKVIFMGTPDFSVGTLEALIEAGHDVVLAVTQPDKPKGRGKEMQFTPVKECALKHGIPVYQPKKVREPECIEELRKYEADIMVVIAFGQILPKEILEMTKYGCVNVHASLLPKYRGAAPIQWSIIDGETVTGVTTMQMDEGLDTGDMLLKAETPVGEEETAGELFDRLKDLGADLLLETLKQLEQGMLKPTPQNEEEATHAPMLSKELSVIDWTKPAQEIHDLIRGLNPWPSAYSYLEGKKLKLHASRVREGSGQPGKAFTQDGKLMVYCGEGALELVEIQTENGKRMDGKSYLLGHPLQDGACFTTQN